MPCVGIYSQFFSEMLFLQGCRPPMAGDYNIHEASRARVNKDSARSWDGYERATSLGERRKRDLSPIFDCFVLISAQFGFCWFILPAEDGV